MNSDFVDFSSLQVQSPTRVVNKSASILKLQERFLRGYDGAAMRGKRSFTVRLSDEDAATRGNRSFTVRLDEDPFYEYPQKPAPTASRSEAEDRQEENVEPQNPVVEDAATEPQVQSILTTKEKKTKKGKRVVRFIVPKPTSIVYKGVVHKVWDFGKPKAFNIENNSETQAAAVQIQRLARGGMQRLHYRIQWLQHKIDTRQERTEAEVAQIHDEFDQRKLKFLNKIKEKEAKMERRIDLATKTVEESQKIVDYLRYDNQKLREKNQKLYTEIQSLKMSNERLQQANESTRKSLAMLEANFKQIEKTNKYLLQVEPKFRERVEAFTEALQEQEEMLTMERRIKFLYTTLAGNIVEKLETSSCQESLKQDVVIAALEMELKEQGSSSKERTNV